MATERLAGLRSGKRMPRKREAKMKKRKGQTALPGLLVNRCTQKNGIKRIIRASDQMNFVVIKDTFTCFSQLLWSYRDYPKVALGALHNLYVTLLQERIDFSDLEVQFLLD